MSHPIEPSFKSEWFSVALLILFVLSAFFFANYLPDLVPSHWNFQGQIDAYSSAKTAAWAMPILGIFIYLMFFFLPYFDPKRGDYQEFKGAYHRLKDLTLAFLFIIYFMTNLNGLGYKINISFWIPILVGLLFISIGGLLAKVKANWFVGIRTPWTLSSETVWKKTHQLSNKVFTVAGLLLASTAFLPPVAKLPVFILSLAVIIIALPLYSYILFRQEKKNLK